jgi:Exocyst complex component Sec3
MHHFVAETSQMDISSMSVFSRQAEAIYDENLGAYIKLVIRRPFGRIIVRMTKYRIRAHNSHYPSGLFRGS